MESFHLNSECNLVVEDLDLTQFVVVKEEELTELFQGESTLTVLELPYNFYVPAPTVMPNINNPIQDQEISEEPESLRAAEMTATIEPLPSTSRGLTVANELHSSSSTQTDESSSVETEMDATPTLSTEDILKIRPPLKKCQQKKVPEECKDTEYHTKRMKNVLAARNCRAKKRIIDEKRVTLLKSALEENERLQLEVQRLHGIEASHAKLENDITFLRNVCSHLCSKITEAGGHVNFPQGPP